MTTKEILKENYQQFLCELGAEDMETRVAKQLYDNYCIAEQEIIDKTFRWLIRQYGDMAVANQYFNEMTGE